MDFKFEFRRSQTSKIPRARVIEELERAAKSFDYKDFKQEDFDKISEISSYKVYREFGSWEKALLFLKDHLEKKGIPFELTTRRSRYSLEEIFADMEKVWLKLGHRPSRNEWTASCPEINFSTIERRFGGWQNACLKFIEYKSGELINPEENTGGSLEAISKPKRKKLSNVTVVEQTRTIPLNVRLRVLNRDNFRCVFCGKSPATDIGTKLHIDHIVPFSRGGANTLENLQTLCVQCNLGKSSQEDISTPTRTPQESAEE